MERLLVILILIASAGCDIFNSEEHAQPVVTFNSTLPHFRTEGDTSMFVLGEAVDHSVVISDVTLTPIRTRTVSRIVQTHTYYDGVFRYTSYELRFVTFAEWQLSTTDLLETVEIPLFSNSLLHFFGRNARLLPITSASELTNITYEVVSAFAKFEPENITNDEQTKKYAILWTSWDGGIISWLSCFYQNQELCFSNLEHSDLYVSLDYSNIDQGLIGLEITGAVNIDSEPIEFKLTDQLVEFEFSGSISNPADCHFLDTDPVIFDCNVDEIFGQSPE